MKKTEEKKNLYTNNVTKHDREEKKTKQTNHKYIHTLQTTKKHCAALTSTEEKKTKTDIEEQYAQ